MKIKNLLVIALISLSFTTLSASADKGQKHFTKKLKSTCGISGAAIAGKHTQEGWIKIGDENKMKEEILLICPDVKKSALKDKYIEHYLDFMIEYGSDSGNIPAC